MVLTVVHKTFAVLKKVPANLGPITSLVLQEEVLWVAAGQKVVTFHAKVYLLFLDGHLLTNFRPSSYLNPMMHTKIR